MLTRKNKLALLVIAGLWIAVVPAMIRAGEPDRAAKRAGSGGATEQSASNEYKEYYELFSVLVDTIDQVERNYVEKIDRRELLEAAIQGVLSKLDPYSSYIGPDELSDFKRDVESKFGGIGIQITIDDGQLKVLSPLVGTPAYRAGLRAGDRIVKIEGESTAGITIEEAVKKLKGDVGTRVHITIVHPGSDEQINVAIQREVIRVPTVLGDHRKPDDSWDFMLDEHNKIGYVRITAFSRDTADELRKALDELVGRGMKGLILDLRFNPGGLLSAAIAICDMFVDEGRIVSTEGRNSKPRVWDAHRAGTYADFPMAVLVNRYSASASEIVAACLQDHQRAVVVGERTWGKGSVQNVIELDGGKSVLKLTTAGYLRPSGKNIHRFPGATPEDEWGVRPNKGFEVKLTNAELAGLVLARRQRDIVPLHETGTAQKKASDDNPEEHQASEKSRRSGSQTSSDATKRPDSDQPDDDGMPPETSVPGASEKGHGEEVGKPDRPANESSVEGAEEAGSDPDSDGNDGRAFVDRQLQRAVEYVLSQLRSEEENQDASADAASDTE